jgi:hypothetical protein
MGFNLAFKGLKQGVVQFALRSINFVILFGIKEELFEEWKESIIVPVYNKEFGRET